LSGPGCGVRGAFTRRGNRLCLLIVTRGAQGRYAPRITDQYGNLRAAGGGMFFLPPGHEDKRLYWLLVHPPGDPRLRPIAYDYDEAIVAAQHGLNNNEAPRFAGYWRPRPLDDSGRNTLIPWTGRVGIPFVLYSPDEAVVCGRDPMASALVIGARDPDNPGFCLPQLMWLVRDFGHVACEFAASPRLRNGGGPLLTAVVYLFWDARQNRWVFDDVAVGSSAWTPLAGVVRSTYAGSTPGWATTQQGRFANRPCVRSAEARRDR